MTDPTRGAWTVTVDGDHLVVTHDGDPTTDAQWLTDTIQIAQSNAGLRRRIDATRVPRTAKHDIDPLVDELRRIRKQLAVSQSVVSQVMGCSARRVSEYECGKVRPRLDVLQAWAYVLGHKLQVVPQ